MKLLIWRTPQPRPMPSPYRAYSREAALGIAILEMKLQLFLARLEQLRAELQ